MKTLLFYLIIGGVAGIVTALLDWPITVLYAAILAGFIFSLGQLVYTMAFSQNIKSIEKFLAKNKKDPVYRFLYELGQGSEEGQREALRGVLKKYKNTKYEAVYGAALSMMDENYEAAQQYNAAILHKEEGQYTKIIIDLLAGNEVKVPIPTFKKQWMNKSIEAHEAFVRGDVQAFDARVQEVLAASKGVQHYGNYFSFAKMRKQLA